MYMKLKDGKSKVLTLSYDDAVVQDIRFMEILNRNGIKAAFNVNSGMYLAEDAVREKYAGRMKLSEAQALYVGSGHEVGAHAVNHPFLDRLKLDEVFQEIIDDRKNLEKQFGTIVRGMAYPFGTYNSQVIDALKMCGICYCRTTKSTEEFKFPEQWLALHPTCHHKNPRLMELAQKFVEQKPRYSSENWMFYLWGHSYEFDNDNNWDVIENFARYAGNREDIWYATNIEIYDYIKAYENLHTSADKTVIYNPCAIDVWFEVDKKTYCVRGGETIRI